MTVLKLTRGWLLNIATGQLFSSYTDDSSANPTYTEDGDVVNHAGGRQRGYSIEGEAGEWPVTFVDVKLADITLLRSWKSETVLYRNHRGQAMYGIYFAVVPQAHKTPSLYNVQITLHLESIVAGV
ncbi:hypothetical protein [Winogradskya humida]|uniref:Phage tail-like protein n=1 Tax=Winogradskya humida TaxID=113566 RepID=A0ABQ4A7A8_9ACTN|nr:hypothetical protein [Actinoplanes humidus]GIE26698.1 hypothetical protein Ahu01nite_098000 [Actinoplanes humidus]